jgi:predicted RNase H-like nuclease (RuvC/YqgF family)
MPAIAEAHELAALAKERDAAVAHAEQAEREYKQLWNQLVRCSEKVLTLDEQRSDLQARLAELQAQTVAMRDALVFIEREAHPEDGLSWRTVHRRAVAALATRAGRVQLAEMEVLREVAEAVRTMERATSLDSYGAGATFAKIALAKLDGLKAGDR